MASSARVACLQRVVRPMELGSLGSVQYNRLGGVFLNVFLKKDYRGKMHRYGRLSSCQRRCKLLEMETMRDYENGDDDL